MPKLVPLSRKELIRKLRTLGFDGPFIATRHQYMSSGTTKIFIPNPHKSDIGAPLLRRIIKQISISRDEFINL